MTKQGHVDLVAQNQNRLRCEHLINRFDDMVTQYESKWGIEALPRLVDFDLAENWRLHMQDLNDAIQRQHPGDLQDLVDGAARGLAALEKAAIAAGHKPHDAEYWAAKLKDGRELRIYKSVLDSMAPGEKGVVRYSLGEIAALISGLDVANEVKEVFGGRVET